MPSAPSKSTYAINSKGQWLNGNAAASYLRMLAAGCPAGGISGKGAGRTYAEQAALYAAYKASISALSDSASSKEPPMATSRTDPHRAITPGTQ